MSPFSFNSTTSPFSSIYKPPFFLFFEGQGCSGQFTRISTNFLPGSVKDKSSTPALEDSQEITTMLQPDLKNRILINCISNKLTNQPD